MQDDYADLYQNFRWAVPEYFNIAEACCRRWAKDKNRTAIFFENEAGETASASFAQIQSAANQLSRALRASGIKRGDVVALILPQRIETAVAHIACYQLGAVAMPLSVLFGADALQFRLGDAQAKAAIVASAASEALQSIAAQCPSLQTIVGVDAPANKPFQSFEAFETFIAPHRKTFAAVKTRAQDPAVLIYTSGTTGNPKGALIPHRALIGNLTGFVASQNWYPQVNDVFWSPADWAWTGGLMDALLPAMYFGMPIVAYQGRFSAEAAFSLLEKYQVTNTFLFPTALKIMMKAYAEPHKHYRLSLRAIMSAGEAVGETVFHWCENALGVRVNEMFGQTEINYIVGNSSRWPARAGSMGKAYPGHRVAVINEAGELCKTGEIGDVAVNRFDIHGVPDPIFFLGYWRNAAATQAKFSGDWCRTGDLASQDADGYLWYQGRADDMFKAAGYRIGPSEIENCLLKHPAVANAAVVPKPDAERGAVVKAYIVLVAGISASDALSAQLQAHVRGKLAPYEYPKEIEYIAQLPMTTTGKVQRRVLREIELKKFKEHHND